MPQFDVLSEIPRGSGASKSIFDGISNPREIYESLRASEARKSEIEI
jgi:hypothetical protein